MTILDTLDLASAATHVRVLTGEDAAAARRADRAPSGKSDCICCCPDAATAGRCVEALRASDECLRNRPEELMLWDWQRTYREPEPGSPNGGGTVLLGTALCLWLPVGDEAHAGCFEQQWNDFVVGRCAVGADRVRVQHLGQLPRCEPTQAECL